MRRCLFLFIGIIFFIQAKAGFKDSTIYYIMPDSIKAVQFMAEISFADIRVNKRMSAGISFNGGELGFSERKGKRGIFIKMHDLSRMLSSGENVTNYSHGSSFWEYDWQLSKVYKLMISTAFDSASKLTVYSAYIFLPDQGKWKFLVCRKHPFYDSYLKNPSSFIRSDKKTEGNIIIGQVWAQRSNSSWKSLKDEIPSNPTINWFGHLDSAQQRQTDIEIIKNAIASGKTDVKNNEQGVYYTMMKEGTGRQVTVNDTVTVFYKGYLFANDSVFDQTKDKPATFPLNRLIRGWQIGVPLCKVGGRIKLVIPPELGYSIRTRAAKIPPNSILVFEIEVLDAKATEQQPGN